MSTKSLIAGLPIGIGTTFDYSVPLEPMCRMIAQAGFKAIMLGGGDVAHSGYDTEDGRKRICEIVGEFGLRVDSVHAPFGPECDLSTPDVQVPAATSAGAPVAGGVAVEREQEQSVPQAQPESAADTQPATGNLPPTIARVVSKPSPMRLAAVARVENAIQAAMSLDSQIVIIHPTAGVQFEDMRARIHALRNSLRELIPYALHRNVRLALENLPSLLSMQVFEAVLDEFPELGVCYDSSHAQISTHPFGVLQRFRERIIATHVSDNRGVSDDHMLPFEGVIDWDEFAFYAGKLPHLTTFMLEVEVRESAFKDTREFLTQAFQRTQRLLNQ
jgi:sugar phosphate isomerase/epimerase